MLVDGVYPVKRIILKPGEEKRILAGHPWVYDNEVARVFKGGPVGAVPIQAEDLEPGECADIESAGKKYLGRAFVNPRSKIIARIYSPSKEGLDKGLFKRRIREAIKRRSPAYDLLRESARLVYGEADFLPGLIVDRFTGWPREELEAATAARPLGFDAALSALGPPRSWLALQFLARGTDCRREMILRALEEVFSGEGMSPAGVVERSPARIRELEGLPPAEGLVSGDFPTGGIVIFENGLPFEVHLETGQKTGYFLDQKENRLRAARLFRGGRVLDLYAYTGGFGIHAARFAPEDRGAEVIAVDSSEDALKTLGVNARLNGLENRINTLKADVFDLLPQYERERERFDLVILDPPAFAKTRSARESALRGYREINRRAIALLAPGGILVSASCSQALDEGGFKGMIAEAAADAERRLALLDFRYQAADHPVLVGYDESLYLKCGFYRALPRS
jgi:23S rRNA (cytosine1962-C5)-methyltransferase